MQLNDGYSYREVLTTHKLGPSPQTVFSYLSGRYRHSAESDWQARLGAGEVLLSGRTASGLEELKPGQELIWNRPPWPEHDVPLHFGLAHQDGSLLAVIKPSGLPTLPGGGFLNHTLLHLVRRQFPEASPLHRLGRGTSGLVLFARNRKAASELSREWREHGVQKTYLALASGQATWQQYDVRAAIGPVPHPRLGMVFAANPEGKPSRSTATVLEQRPDSVLFSVDILTGRPHQIRIHLAFIGHPLIGDPLYAPGGLPRLELPGLPGDGGYLLHAAQLSFIHPVSGERIYLQAPAPTQLQPGGRAPEPSSG
ncbi:RluA family pseudouridine synthase [Deinococcus altitudinis]|uniref:RluA family pseudouridine synthase n=1 Tax=Deinococcus altitudinis TaxID=468914 RepID=UPI0038920CC1